MTATLNQVAKPAPAGDPLAELTKMPAGIVALLNATDPAELPFLAAPERPSADDAGLCSRFLSLGMPLAEQYGDPADFDARVDAIKARMGAAVDHKCRVAKAAYRHLREGVNQLLTIGAKPPGWLDINDLPPERRRYAKLRDASGFYVLRHLLGCVPLPIDHPAYAIIDGIKPIESESGPVVWIQSQPAGFPFLRFVSRKAIAELMDRIRTGQPLTGGRPVDRRA
jgi:hypothetical protein